MAARGDRVSAYCIRAAMSRSHRVWVVTSVTPGCETKCPVLGDTGPAQGARNATMWSVMSPVTTREQILLITQTTNTGVIADWPIKAENINGTDKYNYVALSKKRYLIFMDTFC